MKVNGNPFTWQSTKEKIKSQKPWEKGLEKRKGQKRSVETKKKMSEGREVVPDDLIILSEGDRIPADALMIDLAHLNVDESLLTGESLPVNKEAGDKIFSGTLVVAGSGTARVIKTGTQTEMGKIGKSLEHISDAETLLQKDTKKLVKVSGILGIIFSVLVVIAHFRALNNLVESILAGLATAMSLLPEEFPVVVAIFLSLGAWKLSQKNVLVRHLGTTENIGSLNILCVDKTGTLTENKMTVSAIDPNNHFTNEDVIKISMLASHTDPFDPMEKAIKEAAKDLSIYSVKFLREYPLRREMLAMARIYEDGLAACKGAPETIAKLCHYTESQLADLHQKVSVLADQGMRVLGVAQARISVNEGLGFHLPESITDFQFEFVGLIALSDPLRSTVPDAIKECHQAGVRVMMITGDYPNTAQAIAKLAGIKNEENILTGEVIERLDQKTLSEKLKTVNVCARMAPEQKLKIVNALKANGLVVGMTGDGVNDAPSLMQADVGIAMGKRGTDVAREASDLVLTDDHFASIVAGIRQGRKIFDNIKKAMSYVFSIHIPIAGMAMIPVLLGWPSALLPAHIVFLELVIDPACTLAFEAEKEEKNIMARPPRDPL
jgi:Ca2+-transporting ATPase